MLLAALNKYAPFSSCRNRDRSHEMGRKKGLWDEESVSYNSILVEYKVWERWNSDGVGVRPEDEV